MAVEDIHRTYGGIDANAPHSRELAIRIPALLRTKRIHRGLRLSDVARLCSTTPQTIQRLETGEMTMSLEWLDTICRALEISQYDVFSPEWRAKP